MHCKCILDPEDVRRYLTDPDYLENEDAVYGVSKNDLAATGPSVISINGLIASAGMTEFMVAVTGMREPTQLQTYRADLPRMTKDIQPSTNDCPYCKGSWNRGADADVERYLELKFLGSP